MTPKISVIMAVRNGARWLGEAIASVQNQTRPDLELIVVDDGSADASPRIIAERSRDDARIRGLRQEPLGLVAALNRGLGEARGQLIARLDADDIAHPRRLECQADYLDLHPQVGLLGTWANRIDETGSIVGSLTPLTNSEQLASLLMRTNPFVHSSVMMRKTVLQAVGSYRTAFEGAEDYDLWLRMAEVSALANLPEHFLQYRVHAASVSHRGRVRQLFSARLAQRAAELRRAKRPDPTRELTAPPDWRTLEAAQAPVYGEWARVYCLLDQADVSNIDAKTVDALDIAMLDDRKIVLNHAERKMAQLALLNLLRSNLRLSKMSRAVLLRHFVRLHPLRAAYFGYQSLRNW